MGEKKGKKENIKLNIHTQKLNNFIM